MTPAEELRAAAEQLRTLAKAATQPPWHVVEYDQPDDFEAGLGQSPESLDIVGHGYEGGGFDKLTDAQYVAAMHPGVGAALADWLDSYAKSLAATTHPGWQETTAGPALAVARQILGSQP